MTKVFICYSHENTSHKQWVLNLASDIREGGVDVSIDQWDLRLGQDIGRFMEEALANSDRVIVVCSEQYVTKANGGKGGVGYEKSIITSELMVNQDTLKFVPVVRDNPSSAKIPLCLGSRLYIDFSSDADYGASFDRLLRELHDLPYYDKPPLGINPFTKSPISSVDQQQVDRPNAKKIQVFGVSEQHFIGKTIGGCTIVNFVDSGGFGFVYRAKHKTLGHDVALKISYPLPEDLDYSTLIRFEARAMEQKQLIHPNIARVYGSGTLESENVRRLFVISEFIYGNTLRHFVGPFVNADHARRSLCAYRQLCDAISYAHNFVSKSEFTYDHAVGGLVHGDIKPGNVMVSSDHQAKLVDFDHINFAWFRFTTDDHDGLAEQDGWHWVTAGRGANVFGTPGYMAPELVAGGEPTVKSDVYALGVTLYELCTGEKLPLIRALNIHETLSRSDVESLLKLGGPFVPTWVSQAIAVSIHHNAARRVDTVNQLIATIPSSDTITT